MYVSVCESVGKPPSKFHLFNFSSLFLWLLYLNWDYTILCIWFRIFLMGIFFNFSSLGVVVRNFISMSCHSSFFLLNTQYSIVCVNFISTSRSLLFSCQINRPIHLFITTRTLLFCSSYFFFVICNWHRLNISCFVSCESVRVCMRVACVCVCLVFFIIFKKLHFSFLYMEKTQ